MDKNEVKPILKPGWTTVVVGVSMGVGGIIFSAGSNNLWWDIIILFGFIMFTIGVSQIVRKK